MDKFLKADVQAVFEEQEGVELRENGTQAVIASILPKEEIVLTAKAKLPSDFTEEELINTVLVFPEGEEEKGKSDDAAVAVEKQQPKPPVSSNKRLSAPKKTPAASLSQAPSSGPNRSYTATAVPGTVYSAGTQTDGKGTVYTTSPKTGDESPLLFLLAVTAGAGAVSIVILRCRFRRGK